MENEFNILYYISIFKKYYKKILFLMLLAGFFTFIHISLRKPIYTAKCSILLIENSSGVTNASFGNILTKFSGFAVGRPFANTMITIIKSRRMLEDIYSEFKEELKKYPNFGLKLEVYDTTQGTLILEVKGRDSKLVSDIANFCVKNLDVINTELDITPQRPMAKVLDAAIPPERPDSKDVPKYVGIALIFGFFLGNIIFFSLEYYKTLIEKEK